MFGVRDEVHLQSSEVKMSAGGKACFTVTRDWLESILTSFYIFIEHVKMDPDIQVIHLECCTHAFIRCV